jgi:hypothetical protein
VHQTEQIELAEWKQIGLLPWQRGQRAHSERNGEHEAPSCEQGHHRPGKEPSCWQQQLGALSRVGPSCHHSGQSTYTFLLCSVDTGAMQTWRNGYQWITWGSDEKSDVIPISIDLATATMGSVEKLVPQGDWRLRGHRVKRSVSRGGYFWKMDRARTENNRRTVAAWRFESQRSRTGSDRDSFDAAGHL